MIDYDDPIQYELVSFVEWLDTSQGLVKSPEESRDFRTHEDLVLAYLARFNG